jgi:hypothetical protein
VNSTAPIKAQFFTPEDANRMLPYVRAITGDIVELFKDVHERRHRLARIRQSRPKGDAESPYEQELRQSEIDLDADIDRLDGYIDELRALGLELKDPVRGLVDFPHLLDGREVSLCWMLGEERVANWHELEAGFDGRHALDETNTNDDV